MTLSRAAADGQPVDPCGLDQVTGLPAQGLLVDLGPLVETLGKTVAVSPAVSNRMAEYFPEPDRFDPDRYKAPRQEDQSPPPFGSISRSACNCAGKSD